MSKTGDELSEKVSTRISKLLDSLNETERQQFINATLMIKELLEMQGNCKMEIVSYQKQYKNDFIDLNLAWLNKYFKIEKNDLDMLNGVESLI